MNYNIEITVCEVCNCNCDYCFENKKYSLINDGEIQNKTLYLIKKLCNELTDKDTMSILFWGGNHL